MNVTQSQIAFKEDIHENHAVTQIACNEEIHERHAVTHSL